MAKSKRAAEKKPSSGLLSRQQIQEKLETVLAELKPSLGEKKFKRRMKKAGKLISSGMKKVKAPKAAPAVPKLKPAPAEAAG